MMTDKISDIEVQMVNDLNDIEVAVITGYTLADAMRDGTGTLVHVPQGGDGVSTGCALTIGIKTIKDKGYE